MLKIALRGVLAHKFRLVLTVFAILVSVAFMTGTQVLTGTLSSSFDKIFDDVYKNIDAVVRSSNKVDTGFGPVSDNISASFIPTIQAVDGVEAVEGQVQGLTSILDKDGAPTSNANAGPPTFGFNWLTEPALNGWRLTEGSRPPERDDEVVIDEISAEKAGYKIGDTVGIAPQNKPAEQFKLVGLAGFGSTRNYAGSSAALFTDATAQRLFTAPGEFTLIQVAGDPNVTQVELRNRIDRALPPDSQTEVITGRTFTDESADPFRKFFDVIGTALFVFGLIALIVGAFIIYNTFSIIVAQRTRELALLRATGASRRQVLGSVTVEALVTGVVASTLGVLGGIGLGWLLLQALAATGAGAADSSVTVRPNALISSIIVGTVVTLLSAMLPAWRASRVPPVAAMRDVAIDTGGRTRVRFVVSGALTLVGALLMYLGLFGSGDNAVAKVGVGTGLVFFGFAGLLPLVAAPFAGAIGAVFPGVTGRLARANAQRNPRRTANTASALMIGVGLIVLFSILGQSVKSSFEDAIGNSIKADLIVNAGNFGQSGFAPELQQQIADVPGVELATGLRFWFAQVTGTDGKPAPTPIYSVDPARINEVQTYEILSGSWDALGMDVVGVGKDDAEKYGWKVGDTIDATFLTNGTEQVQVGMIYSTGVQGQDTGLLMTPEAFAARVPAQNNVDNIIFVNTASGANVDEVKAAIKKITKAEYPTATVETLAEYSNSALGFFDILIAVVQALVFLAVLIALIGIVNTLLLSVFERTRELGLLRAVGTTRKQLRRTIRLESVLIAMLGTLAGTAIGFLFAWALVTAIAQDNPVRLVIPWSQVIFMIIFAAIAGVLAALYPAWKASRLDVLQAIATD